MTEIAYPMVPRHHGRGSEHRAEDRPVPGGCVVPAYEVDDAAGRCLYRGTDLELACEIHDLDPAAHLLHCDSGPRLSTERTVR